VSVDYGARRRRDFINAIEKVIKAADAAHILFSVTDDLLIDAGENPMLIQNKDRVISEFAAIYKHLHGIKVTMAEDKHGRVRL